jgi:hypothetical protein
MSLFNLASRAGIPAAKSAMRFLSKLKKPPKTGGITLYRGEDLKHLSSKAEAAKHMYAPQNILLKSSTFDNPSLRASAMGRWFSNKPSMAMGYAGNRRYVSMFKNPKDVLSWGGGYEPGVVKKLTLSAKEARIANRLANRLHGIKGGGLDDFFVVPKKSLARAETDKFKTFIANFYRMIGKKHGGLARILEV